jgi:hypothetical protein
MCAGKSGAAINERIKLLQGLLYSLISVTSVIIVLT